VRYCLKALSPEGGNTISVTTFHKEALFGMDKEMPEAKYWGGVDKDSLPGDWPGGGGVGTGPGLLDEIRFWTGIMRDHAMFIAGGLPCDRTDLIREAQRLEERFAALEAQLNRVTAITPNLLRALREAVRDLIAFKEGILRMMIQCQLRPNLYPLLINHVTREAIHFLAILEQACENQSGEAHELHVLLDRVVFWMRIMKEHIEFMIHLLDPSERLLIRQAKETLETFVGLYQTAMDLESMAQQARPQFFNTAARFVDEAIARTAVLRDFKAEAYELLVMCRLLSAITSPLLVDHIRREADRAILEMREIREQIPVRRPPSN
jgi:hypothetical protein